MSRLDWFHCDCCGRYVSPGAPGVSGSQTWGYSMGGEPELHDPVFRCASCTDKFGIRETNCANPEAYQWRNSVEAST